MTSSQQQTKTGGVIARIIFGARWLQAPLYLGLIFAQLIYVYQFLHELYMLIKKTGRIEDVDIMLTVLGLIDVVMISNLLTMVVIGGYETFVSRLYTENHPDQPEWLDHVNANTMKIKLSMALVAISSIHLLKTFFRAGVNMSNEQVFWQVIIHIVFLFSSVALAFTAKYSDAKSVGAA